MSNRVSEILGCRYPVISGAMGVISNPELVAAVSEAGGFGVLATAFQEDPGAVREQVRALNTPMVSKINCGEFGVNDAFCRAAFKESWIRGNLDAGLLPTGQSAGLIRDIPSAKDVVREMVAE